MTQSQASREAMKERAAKAHDMIDDQLALKWEYVAAYSEGWQACESWLLRESELMREVREALEWYAEGESYADHWLKGDLGNEYQGKPILDDRGERARAVLQRLDQSLSLKPDGGGE